MRDLILLQNLDMKIALIGYGKMGKIIERIANERGHEITAVFNSSSPFSENISVEADVAIEFTRPDQVIKNIEIALKTKLPIVVGTTAWNEQLEHVKNMVNASNGTLLYASNFSLGVNIFQRLTEELSRLITPYAEYQLSIEETHHVQKLDAPSGTAVSLANAIIANHNEYQDWKLGPTEDEKKIPIIAHRIPDVPGTHVVKATCSIDTISLSHEAHNRDGFALGSILAAEFLLGKRGVFTMQDVLKLK